MIQATVTRLNASMSWQSYILSCIPFFVFCFFRKKFTLLRMKVAVFVLLLLPFLSPGAKAEEPPWQVGDNLESISFVDQYGEAGSIDKTVRLLLFASDRAAAKLVHSVLEETEPAYLQRHEAVYVADISGMPYLIARFFALPRMRKYPYRMLLGRKPLDCVKFPRREGLVTLMRLEELKIVEIVFRGQHAEIVRVVEGG